ncbi:hypothetical protein LOK49_Contig590G00002 [Camellia lanceoleosa]|nr:hypothetical protein LOK49_Contig590G00002 [Camellia lanceoleosa]
MRSCGGGAAAAAAASSLLRFWVREKTSGRSDLPGGCVLFGKYYVPFVFQMEVVCLNSEPVFDEEDEYEDEGDCSLMEHDDELSETQSKKEPPPPTIGLEFDSLMKLMIFTTSMLRDKVLESE